jgi:hypothetical protein
MAPLDDKKYVAIAFSKSQFRNANLGEFYLLDGVSITNSVYEKKVD